MNQVRDIQTVSLAAGFLPGEVIHHYSRAQALADGVLVDVSATAREAGIKFPVALSANVHAAFVQVPEGVRGQDELGRLWDILWAFRFGSGNGSERYFSLHVVNHNGREVRAADLVRLKAVCGPGDNAAPVITILLPTED